MFKRKFSEIQLVLTDQQIKERKRRFNLIRYERHEKDLKVVIFNNWINSSIKDSQYLDILNSQGKIEFEKFYQTKQSALQKVQAKWTADILCSIVEFLDMEKRLEFKAVAHVWNETSKKPTYWKSCIFRLSCVSREGTKTENNNIYKLAQHCKRVETGLYSEDNFSILNLKKFMPNLSQLIFNQGTLKSDHLRKLYKFPCLTRFSAKMTDKSRAMKLLFWNHPKVISWEIIIIMNNRNDLDQVPTVRAENFENCHTLILDHDSDYSEGKTPLNLIRAMPNLKKVILSRYAVCWTNQYADKEVLKISHPQLVLTYQDFSINQRNFYLV